MVESRREKLQSLLETLLGTANVYFQPPPDLIMQYPCIVYERDNASRKAADNIAYNWQQRYQVTYMDYNPDHDPDVDYDPDSDVIRKLMEFPYSRFDRHFATSGLNHDVFVIYH